MGSKIGGLSSLLIATPVVIGFFGAALIANFWGATAVSVLALFLGLLGLSSRLWGLASLNKVEVSVSGAHPAMFAGEEVSLRYTVENRKLLPLTWLELCQDLPPNSCLVPISGFERYDLTFMEAQEEKSALYRKRLAFLMGDQSLSWGSRWRAERRGIYQLGKLYLRSGDGFGLAQSAAERRMTNPPTFVVYPEMITVDVSSFLKNLWSGQTGANGYFEDVTVLKTVRSYQNGDSWKRIDWRMAARQEDLQVKQFETIQPQTIQFIVDGASFLGLSPDNDELEQALSVLASVLVKLEERGVRCGLSLPQTAAAPNLDLAPDDKSLTLQDLLFQLAGFDGNTATELFGGDTLATLQNTVGQMYLLSHSGGRAGCGPLLRQLDLRRLTVLAYDPAEPAESVNHFSPCAVRPLLALKGGERHG